MNDIFLKEYYEEYNKKLKPKWLFSNLSDMRDLIESTTSNGGKVIFGGNGASAAIASHAALDFSKQAKIESLTFHDPVLITAYSNDFGYENWLKKVLESNLKDNDLLILISVSGESPNILNAAEYAKSKGIKIATFSGKEENNSLKRYGNINFWVDSHAYNIVEGIHMIWITTIVDMIIGKSVYSVS